MNRKSDSRQLLVKRIVKRSVLVMFSCERCRKSDHNCIVAVDRPKCANCIKDKKLCDLWIRKATWNFIDRARQKLEKEMKTNRLKFKQQKRFVEEYGRLFRESNKKFEKENRKTFRLNKLRRHFDKREKASVIQDFDLLDLLNNLNSNQESFMIQRFSDFEHFVSSKFSLMLTICSAENLLILD